MKVQDYQKYQDASVELLEVVVAGKHWQIERSADLETLWEEICADNSLDADERLPYWAEIWPSSLFLCDWLAKQQPALAGARCLDLGCGLGLSTLVGAWHGAKVVGMDYEWPALHFARRNAKRNGFCEEPGADGQQTRQAPGWLLGDWRQPAMKPGAFSFIWGADIMYERRFIEPVAAMLEYALAPGGTVWFAAPERKLVGPFSAHLESLGWTFRKAATELVRPVTVTGPEVLVNIWEFKKS